MTHTEDKELLELDEVINVFIDRLTKLRDLHTYMARAFCLRPDEREHFVARAQAYQDAARTINAAYWGVRHRRRPTPQNIAFLPTIIEKLVKTWSVAPKKANHKPKSWSPGDQW